MLDVMETMKRCKLMEVNESQEKTIKKTPIKKHES